MSTWNAPPPDTISYRLRTALDLTHHVMWRLSHDRGSRARMRGVNPSELHGVLTGALSCPDCESAAALARLDRDKWLFTVDPDEAKESRMITRAAYWVAVVVIDGLDLAAHLIRAAQDWRTERAWRATSGAVTTRGCACPEGRCHACWTPLDGDRCAWCDDPEDKPATTDKETR